MKRSWTTYAGLASMTVAALFADASLAQEELLYSLEVGTAGTVQAVPGKAATKITSFPRSENDYTASSLPLPPDLVDELNVGYDAGPDGPLIKFVVVTRGSAKVWECDWNDAGDWECKLVNH